MRPGLNAEHVRPLGNDESFNFRCHQGLSCFTECCRELELPLGPYDALRLRENLGLASAEFLKRHALFEETEEGGLPAVYLGMVDDGRASCPFVGPAGCRVYPDRPAACRTYPVGRGAYLGQDGEPNLVHILLREPHCQGFAEEIPRMIPDWLADQGITPYNECNDEMLAILQHPALRQGQPARGEEIEIFLMLYDLDRLRTQVIAASPAPSLPLAGCDRELLARDAVALLRFGIKWLRHVLDAR